jgi:drug/metabolite transporter (DMT)-like permease
MNSPYSKSTDRVGVIQMVVGMAIAGTIGWFVIASGQPIIDVVFWRCVFGAITLLIACGISGLLKRSAMSRPQLALAAVGGIAVILNWLLLFEAYPRSSISIATMLNNMQPFMLVALGAALFGERPPVIKLVWLAMAFAGVAMLAYAPQQTSGHSGYSYLLGIGFALGSAFFYAVASVVAKRLDGVAPILIVLVQMIVGTVVLAPFAHLTGLPTETGIWASLATIGIVHTGIVFILLYSALQKLPTHLVGALSFTYPLVAIMVDMLVYGHRLQAMQIAGCTVILFAVAATTLDWTPWPKRKAFEPGTSSGSRSEC